MRKLTVVAIVAVMAQLAGAQFDGFGLAGDANRTKEINFQAIPSHSTIIPDGTVTLALEIDIEDKWVYYSPDPGEIVVPGEIKVTGENIKLLEVLWPADKTKTYIFGDQTQTNNVYTGKVVVFVRVGILESPEAPQEVSFTVALGGQVCLELCKNIEGVQESLTIALGDQPIKNPEFEKYSGLISQNVPADRLSEIRKTEEKPQQAYAGTSTTWSFWTAFGVAVLAGLSLNIMPCVLPVIPIRILSIVNSAGHSRKRFVVLGLSFALGIFVFFAVVGLVNLLLRLTTAQAFNFSQLFQYREVRILLALIVVGLAGNLFGVFNVIVPSKVAAIGAGKRSASIAGTISMGIMMAVLSTPCSAAFVAGAFAWAQVNPPLAGTVIIAAMGLGMAIPHVLLCAFPQLVDKLPKPGKWMEMFRQAMGFVLLPVAAWLIGTLGADTYPVWVTCFAIVFLFGLWMWSSWIRYDSPRSKKIIIRSAAVLLVAGAAVWMLPKPTGNGYEYVDYSASSLQAARDEGRTVVLKFTASWCTKCKILEQEVFKTSEITELFERNNVYAIKGNVTDKEMPAARLLNKQYGGAPPVTVVFRMGLDPKIFIGGFKKQDLIDAVEK